MTTLSPLPRSLDPLADESLPGYLLRLAHRLGLAPARVMQLTSLTDSHDGHHPARRSLMMQLDEAAARSFARAARLTSTETEGLCLSSMSGRYPWAAPAITADQWGPRSLAGPWVFTSATRYCPQCLAGDSSSIQQQHGGAWRKTWRLPVVFACPLHRRLLEHLCPSCGQPA
ncbi:MAG: TniQ family protein, partial [Streptosporangiaceae bacterium]